MASKDNTSRGLLGALRLCERQLGQRCFCCFFAPLGVMASCMFVGSSTIPQASPYLVREFS
jgi:hypothetical protein